ncbi:ThiF family adenylyltransferase [Halomonas sp. A40-4]|nr:ThiF family adenylyltransferase [Halomonas sp. A40-4]
MNALADRDDIALKRGIAALQSFLGEDNASALLRPAPLRAGEAKSFFFPLPVDYTGMERRLRISFPSNFPREQLRLHIEPPPWLVWPHAMKSGLCLHGFQERPVTGSPEAVVNDSMYRLGKIVSLSEAGSSKARRDAEFQSEITSYWSIQHGQSSQNLILLHRPQGASELFALSDPRHTLSSGQRPIWLASDVSVLKSHYRRVVGRSAIVRAAVMPAFYVKMLTYPDVRTPDPKHLLPWLTPHLKPGDAKRLQSWFAEHGSLISRWIVLELPGGAFAPIYCLNLVSHETQSVRGTKFGLRSARRSPVKTSHRPPARVRASELHVLDRDAILSRDLSGTAKSLENSRVVCIGVGSLGSPVALQLARSGVGHLTLIDPDTLESANLGRHVLGADDLGSPKATALRERIRRDLPTIEVAAHATFAEVVMDKEPDVFDKADLVIVTTADWQSEVTFWRAKSSGTTWGLLQAWSEPHTHVGHALLAPSGTFDATGLFRDNGDFKYKLTEWPRGGIVALPACGESFIPGGSLGMVNIASMVSQTALRTLTGNVKDAVWVSSIYRPQDVAELGGEYLGPELPDGVRQSLLEREWPENKERTE